MNRETMQNGKCLCGETRFSVENVELKHHVCHCGMCRTWGGGGPLFASPANGVTWEEEKFLKRYDSSKWAERGFCGNCGTSLFYRSKPTDQYMFSVGVFENSADFEVIGEIFIDRKPNGYALAGDHPRETEAEVLAKFAPPNQ